MSYEDMSLFEHTPRTYKYFDEANAVFKFGTSLSYTSFATALISSNESAATISVTNEGSVPGASVIFAMAQYRGDAPPTFAPLPKQLLVAFDKTPTLNPGESWRMTLPFDELSFVDSFGARFKVKGTYDISIDAASSQKPTVCTIEIPETRMVFQAPA